MNAEPSQSLLRRSYPAAVPITRREAIKRGAALTIASSAAASEARFALSRSALAASTAAATVPLPTPRQVRADFQRMVDFGPRLTGTRAHHEFLAWLEAEFATAGLNVLPCEATEIECWEAGRFGLEILDGSRAGPVKVATYYTRSQETPPEGIEAPLVYSGNGPAEGKILVADLPLPAPAAAGVFLPQSTYRYWPGHSDADWVATDYTRAWIEPGVALPLAPYAAMGAKAVVFILNNISFDALKGAYLPFTAGFESLPALFVDRDTGAALREQATAGQNARFVLEASRKHVKTPTVTAVLPGRSEETIIFSTHTDGQNFTEENGGVAFVHLARHFASLPKEQRLERTLVFAAWPGHMYGEVPETKGWMAAHNDLVERAVAAQTLEHLGCTEWVDGADGYRATGEPEVCGIYASDGKMSELAQALIPKHDLIRHTTLRPPPQFGVGGAFQEAGIPQVGLIAGPTYLLTVSDNGEMDKLDENLAARQIAWAAELTKAVDRLSAEELGAEPSGSSEEPEAPEGVVECAAPQTPTLRLRARPRRTKAGRRRRFRFFVRRSYAGTTTPARGAVVRVGRKRARTGASGRASLRLRLQPGKYRVTATQRGARRARRWLRVR
jgi:hypothetical protein